LATPRKDDPLKGVAIPKPAGSHPNSSQPSLIEKLHAGKVSYLPLRNDQGSYGQHTPPDLSSSSAIGDYIQSRTAAWSQHLQRLQSRRVAYAAQAKKPTARKAKRKRRK
jgi:phospholipase C